MTKESPKYIYQIKDLSFRYKLGSQSIPALHNININIPQHALITFSGPSGSGKSTLLNILGLIEPLQEGNLLLRNEEVSLMNENQKNQIRKFDIGFIFQQFHLIPVFTAEENVAHFLTRQNLTKTEIRHRTHESLNSVGLWQHRMKRPSELSGGQRQRVAIARAIAKKPQVIIGDEPTASLDQETGKEIMEIFHSLVQENRVSIILTTHDPMVQSFSHQNFHIQDGMFIDGMLNSQNKKQINPGISP